MDGLEYIHKEKFAQTNRVIYAVHNKNTKKIIEIWYDFMSNRPLRLYNYTIIHIRKITNIELDSLKRIALQKYEQGKKSFNRRFYVIAYNSFGGFAEDEARFNPKDSKEYKTLCKKVKPHFLKLKKQLEII